MALGKKYEIDMTSGAILPKLLLFAVPLAFSSILQLLFNAADVIVVGRFAGDNSLAAVGANASLITLLTNTFVGLSVGANVVAARFYGAREYDELSEAVHSSMVIGGAGGLMLAFIGVLCARTFLSVMQTPAEVLPLAARYLMIYSLGMPSMMIYNFGSAVLRAVGDTRRPLYYLTAAGIVNVALNLIFVICFGWGVAGVALATIISQTLSASLVVRCLMRNGGSVRLAFSKLRLYPVRARQIFRIGLPAGVQGVLFSLSNVAIQSAVNSYGAAVVAGASAAQNIESFTYISMNAFYQTVLSYTSQNVGAGKMQRVMKGFWRTLACVIVTGGVMGHAIYFFGAKLLSIYTSSPAVIEAGLHRMSVISTAYFIGGSMEVLVGVLRGLGYSVMPTVVTLVGSCLLRLVWLATIWQIPAFHTITIVYMSYPVTWLVTASTHALCLRWGLRRIQQKDMR